MSNWKQVSDFVNFSIKGITPQYVENSSIIVLNQKCIRNGRIDYSFSQYTDDTKQISESKFVKRGDILINSTGTGTAGRCAFVSELPENHHLITDSHILLLRCNSYHEAQCLSYLLFSFEKTLMSFMTGSSGQSELDKVVLLNLKTKLPTDSNIQQKIAKVLSDLDAKIELNNRINNELEAIAKTLYNYWFVQFDFPDANGKPYKSSGGKMLWNEELKREIPKGWESGELKNLFNLNPTLSIKKGTVSSYIDMNALPTDGYMTKAVQEKEFSGGVKFQNGDVIVARITPCLENGKAGLISLLGENEVGFGSTEFIVLRGRYIPLSCFGAFLVRSELFRKYAIANMLGTSGRKRVEATKLGSFPMAIPTEVLLRKFEKIISAHFKQATLNTKENQELASLRDWLLPMLMNGQITVAVAEEIINEQLGMVAETSVKYQLSLTDKDKKIRRKMLATYIINQSLNDNSFGKTKFEKLLHLIECHIVKGDYNQRYSVQAAGPYDGGFTKVFWNEVTKAKWFKIVEFGMLKRIMPAENHTKSLVDYGYLSDDLKWMINDFIGEFKNTNYERPEIVSTLYAVWNNRIIRNEIITDELLKKDFLEWDTQKVRYKDRLDKALKWMRENAIIPDGWGTEIKRAKK